MVVAIAPFAAAINLFCTVGSNVAFRHARESNVYKMAADKIVRRPIAKINPYARNARRLRPSK